jgi:PilZ domain
MLLRGGSTDFSMLANPLEVMSDFPGPHGSNNGLRDAPNHPPTGRTERRMRVRTMLHWPIMFFRNGSGEAVESVTQNLSSSGFYCHSRVAITPGESLHCALTIPSHDPSGHEKARVLECRVRVTRVEPGLTEHTFGIACQIQDYHLAVAEERPEHTGRDH